MASDHTAVDPHLAPTSGWHRVLEVRDIKQYELLATSRIICQQMSS